MNMPAGVSFGISGMGTSLNKTVTAAMIKSRRPDLPGCPW